MIYARSILIPYVYGNERKSLQPGLSSMTHPTVADPLGTCWYSRCAPAQGQNKHANTLSYLEKYQDILFIATSNLKACLIALEEGNNEINSVKYSKGKALNRNFRSGLKHFPITMEVLEGSE